MKMVGKYDFLSNFFPCRVGRYPSVEHAYQAGKTLDKECREEIRHAPTAGKAKRMGRNVVLRPDWEEVKVPLMEWCLRKKFASPTLAQRLLEIEGEIVEDNTWHDTFWGVCSCGGCPKGRNELGKLLMKIRDEISNQ